MQCYSSLIKRQKISYSTVVMVIICLAGFLLCLAAPGNKARDAAEILGSYAFFYSSSLLEKGFFGVITAVSFVILYIPQLMAILAALLSIYLILLNVQLKN